MRHPPAAAEPGTAPAAPAPVAAPTPVAIVAPRSPAPAFVNAAGRSLRVPLVWPLDYAGVTYTAITLRRPGSKEIGLYYEQLAEQSKVDEDAPLYFPIFVDDEGAPVPNAVIAKLDDDDRTDVMARVRDFLPRRLLALTDVSPSGSGPDTGADTGQTSST